MADLYEEQYTTGLVRHWSGADQSEAAMFYIRQRETGVLYEEAIDIIPCRYSYETTDQPIEHSEIVDEVEVS